MRISDWSSDVCSSDLHRPHTRPHRDAAYDHDGAIKPGNPGVAWTGHAFPDQPFRLIGPACRDNIAPVPLAPVGRAIPEDRKTGVEGNSVSVRVNHGGRRMLQQTKKAKKHTNNHH